MKKPPVPNPELLDTVKIIGLGGVGGLVGRYLFQFMASFDAPTRLVFIDGDSFEPKNAQRMFFSEEGMKAEVAVKDILALVPESGVSLESIESYVNNDNIKDLLFDGEVIILAVDNHATRKLVSDYCSKNLKNFCLISGGNDGAGEDAEGYELRGTYGNVQVHHRKDGVDQTPPITTFHPEIDNPADKLPDDLDCVEALKSTPQILFANIAAASVILNATWLYSCESLHYPELCFDIFDGVMRPVPLPCIINDKDYNDKDYKESKEESTQVAS